MKISLLWLATCGLHQVSADVVLNDKIMKLARAAAELSSLAYEEDPPGDGFEHFGFYDAGTTIYILRRVGLDEY
jgi:hypothetical protein